MLPKQRIIVWIVQHNDHRDAKSEPVIFVPFFKTVNIPLWRCFLEIRFSRFDLNSKQLPNRLTLMNNFNVRINPEIRNELFPEEPAATAKKLLNFAYADTLHLWWIASHLLPPYLRRRGSSRSRRLSPNRL